MGPAAARAAPPPLPPFPPISCPRHTPSTPPSRRDPRAFFDQEANPVVKAQHFAIARLPAKHVLKARRVVPGVPGVRPEPHLRQSAGVGGSTVGVVGLGGGGVAVGVVGLGAPRSSLASAHPSATPRPSTPTHPMLAWCRMALNSSLPPGASPLAASRAWQYAIGRDARQRSRNLPSSAACSGPLASATPVWREWLSRRS